MTTARLVLAYSALDFHEAGLLQVALEAKGIEVVRYGNFYAHELVPPPGADGPQVELLVPKERAEEARQVIEEWLASRGQPRAATPLWLCSSCGEGNEAAFEVCWKCGKERT